MQDYDRHLYVNFCTDLRVEKVFKWSPLLELFLILKLNDLEHFHNKYLDRAHFAL